MNGANGRNAPPVEVALGPLNDKWKFFLAHLPFTATQADIRDHFSQFGTVNFVKLVYDNKTGKSKGYGFLYMNDYQSDAAVEAYAIQHQNRVQIMNKSGVFLARNDQKRQNPIRNPNKNSHDEGISMYKQHQQQYQQHQQQQQQQQQQQHPPQVLLTDPSVATPYQYPYVADPSYGYNAAGAGAGAGASIYNGQQISHYGSTQPEIMAPVGGAYTQPPVVPLQQHSYPASTLSTVPSVQAGYAPPMATNSSAYNGTAPGATSYPVRLLLENLTTTATPDDVIAGLYQYSLNATYCTIEYDRDPKASWCYAHVELADSEQTSRCLSLAQQNLLEFRGRILSASVEDSYPPVQAPPPLHIPQASAPPIISQSCVPPQQPMSAQVQYAQAPYQVPAATQPPLSQSEFPHNHVVYQNPPPPRADHALRNGPPMRHHEPPYSGSHPYGGNQSNGQDRSFRNHDPNKPPHSRNRLRHKRRHRPY